ncbi:MAG: polysaccharide deacetylase family protein [Acidobacteriota bacterium]
MLIRQKVNIPIITYHSIDKSGSVISTEPKVFRQQMKFLSENGYKTVSLKQLAADLLENNSPSPKTVALTFDDGFRNFYSEAFPVLEKYGFTATVFLVTDFCGKYNDWKGNPANLPRSRLLFWREIKELDECGVEFGVHTKTHPDLTKLSSANIESEIVESKAAIENALGKEAKTFAYPYGKFNSSVKQTAENHFKAACSTNLGKIRAGSDFFTLERVDSYYLSNLRIFNTLSTNTFDRYLNIRQAMRSFKSFIYQN